MSLVDLLRRKWHHHDPEIRLAAVKTLDNMSILVEIVQHDPSLKVKNEAVSRITDESLLEQIVMYNQCHVIALAALQRITHEETIFLIVIKAKKLAVRNAAIELIKNERFLVEILKSCSCLSTCVTATKQITDVNLLKELHINNKLNPHTHQTIKDRIKYLTQSSLNKKSFLSPLKKVFQE